MATTPDAQYSHGWCPVGGERVCLIGVMHACLIKAYKPRCCNRVFFPIIWFFSSTFKWLIKHVLWRFCGDIHVVRSSPSKLRPHGYLLRWSVVLLRTLESFDSIHSALQYKIKPFLYEVWKGISHFLSKVQVVFVALWSCVVLWSNTVTHNAGVPLRHSSHAKSTET